MFLKPSKPIRISVPTQSIMTDKRPEIDRLADDWAFLLKRELELLKAMDAEWAQELHSGEHLDLAWMQQFCKKCAECRQSSPSMKLLD
jgi:hypothetical protein